MKTDHIIATLKKSKQLNTSFLFFHVKAKTYYNFILNGKEDSLMLD